MTYEEIRDKAVVQSVVVGVASGPLPMVDPPGMAIVLGKAIYELAKLHKRELDLDTAGKLALSIMTSVATYMTSIKVFSLVLYLFPLLGLVANMGISAAIDALIALRICRYANQTLTAKSFTKADTGECLYMLLMLPSVNELKEISDILRGRI